MGDKRDPCDPVIAETVERQHDHARDLDLRAHGYDVRRFTGRQLDENPAQVAADIRDALARAS
jgi:very-short-patch-repair endonuclease